MIPSLLIIALWFAWLLYETKFLTIRLAAFTPIAAMPVIITPVYDTLGLKSGGIAKVFNSMIPEVYKQATVLSLPIPQTTILLLDMPKTPKREFEGIICCQCRSKSLCKRKVDDINWRAYKIPAKTIKAYGFTHNFNSGCNILRAAMLKEAVKVQTSKVRESISSPCLEIRPEAFIRVVRVGSHRDWIETTPKHGFHRTTVDYNTYYDDNLGGKEWLERTSKTPPEFEPTIEILADGQTLSVNGNYKKGMIKDFMRQFCKPGEGKIRIVKVETALRNIKKRKAQEAELVKV